MLFDLQSMAKQLPSTDIFDDDLEAAIEPEDTIEIGEENSEACKMARQIFTRLRVYHL